MARHASLKFWHRWFGILVGGWLMLLAITGMAIAWYDELDTALNPDLRQTAITGKKPVSLDTVIANAEFALPGFSVNNAILAPDANYTHWLIGRQVLADGSARAMQLFVEPTGGTVTGWRESGALRFDRHHFPDFLYGLHTELLADETGATIVGIIGILWMLDHFLSLPLAFPKRQKWREAFRLNRRKGSLRRLFDWHRAQGVWLWLLTFTITITGVTLTFPNASRNLMQPLSPVSGRLHETMPEVSHEANIGVDAAISRVTSDITQVHSVRIFPALNQYAVRTYDNRDPDNQGRLWTYVSMDSGKITGPRHDVGESAGDLFFAWQYPLHSGHAAGFAGRLIVTFAGLMTILLCYSGLRLVWRRRRNSNSQSSAIRP